MKCKVDPVKKYIKTNSFDRKIITEDVFLKINEWNVDVHHASHGKESNTQDISPEAINNFSSQKELFD